VATYVKVEVICEVPKYTHYIYVDNPEMIHQTALVPTYFIQVVNQKWPPKWLFDKSKVLLEELKCT
jgi:hypothetical protein